ncbi:MAG: aminoglycoside phosphotransferase family protein [bacterium]|nr:aminoglycoside phosphotransferase family protein [bacterium]
MESEQLLLDKISKAYNLSKLSFLREPEKGISTKNIIASAEGGKEYFIKRYKKADLDKIENSERSAKFISENSDIPVVLPLKNNKGELHILIDGQQYCVFSYIPNTETRPNYEVERIVYIKNIGEMLGRIHSVFQGASISKTIKPISAWTLDDNMESIAKYEKILELIKNKSDLDEYDKKAIEFINLKISLLKKNEFIRKEKQSVAVCHGDYHGRNILFDEQWKIIGVCDWDMSGIGNPYSEFIRSFNMCIVRRDFDRLEDKKNETKVFLDSYISKCGFEFDISELEYAIEAWYEKLLTSEWPLSDHYYFGHSKTDPSLHSEFNKVIFLQDKRKQLLELIKSCL